MALVIQDGLVEATALERAEEFLASLDEYPDVYHGRGIVICGGGLTYFTNAWVNISLLRHLGCRLPIQLWYLGRGELDERMEELVAPLGVECIDATAQRVLHPARILNGWEVKPYAILHCPFREVLLLDADNCAVSDPEALFRTWEYRDLGALFWPDLGRLDASHASWSIFGVPYRDEPEIESGQIVVNKETCWKALCLTKHYNDFSDFYYRYVHGDKETFHLAFRKAGQPYAMPSRSTRFERGVFFQADFAGQTVFQHRNGAKWTLHGTNPFIPECRFEAECHGFVEALRVAWDGQIGRPRRTPLPEDLGALRHELASRIHRFSRGGTHRVMSFRSDGHLGLGATTEENTWKVFLSDRGVALEIGTRDHATCVLLRQQTGWRSAAGSDALVPIPRKVAASRRPPLSLTEFVEKVQLYAGRFAWHQYALARDLGSDLALVLGPVDSAAALTIARGLSDSGRGPVVLIDTERDDLDGESLSRRWCELFGLEDAIRYLDMDLARALPIVRDLARDRRIRLLVLDGVSRHPDTPADFAEYLALVDPGAVGLVRDRGSREWRLAALDLEAAATLWTRAGIGLMPEDGADGADRVPRSQVRP
ncbi:MAG TPA: hypothetical protein VNH46_10955 [Gemmatimonadales bacterium]|nr:hypothetical protein [Gemmatimonadales bacterium]